MVVSAASVKVYGEAVLDPAALLERVDNDWIVLAGSVVFVLATIGVNIVANFVSAAFDLSNLNPKRISFKTGGIIASVAALLSTPWNLYNSPQVIAYFLGGLGALLGPFFGIMAVDYFLLRKARLSIPDLYDPSEGSLYYYRNGVNPLAVKAFVPTSIVSLTLALVPAFSVSRRSAGSSARRSERWRTTSSPRTSCGSRRPSRASSRYRGRRRVSD